MKDAGSLRFPPPPAPESGPPVSKGLIGTWLVLICESMLFVGALGAFAVVRISEPEWPPVYWIETAVRDARGDVVRERVRPPKLEPTIPLVNAVVLSAAAGCAFAATRAARRRDLRRTRILLGAVAAFGVAFLGGVAWEVLHEKARGLDVWSGQYGGMIFLITFLHAAHVVVGLIWQGFVLAPALRPGRTLRPERVEHVGVYWGFVSVLWWVLVALLLA
ncbi:MAG TPA: hypothetical protein VEI02_08340 [Planctomycetota bacterium]|nr:hypothetical protein [Planctomycetota bacterium]